MRDFKLGDKLRLIPEGSGIWEIESVTVDHPQP